MVVRDEVAEAPSSLDEGLRRALEMFEVAVQLIDDRVRNVNPDATEDQVAEAVAAWLHDRRHAPLGDAPGSVRPWPPGS